MPFQLNPFMRQPHKMIKHTQTVRRILSAIRLSVFELFVDLTLKGISKIKIVFEISRSR